MPMTTTTLSKMQPGDILRDDQVPGLHARASERRISFYLYFRERGGKERRPKIGDYGALTLPQAREVARGWLLKNASGEAVKPGLTPIDKLTVADLHKRWQRDHLPRLKPGTARGMECAWKNHILPKLGDKYVNKVSDDDIAELFAEISKDSPVAANRVRALLNKAFRLAEKWKWRPQNSNPCFTVDRNKETKRRRYLSLDELQRLGAVLYEWEGRGAWWRKASRYFRLLIMTGARKSEIALARREWLDLDNQILRLPDSKTGEKIVAFPSAAVRLIRQMIEDEPYSEWLCPGKLRGQPINNHWTAWKHILREAGIENLRIHDLRHSFASVGLSMKGMNLNQIGSVLGHSDQATTHRYAHLMIPEHVAFTEAIGGTMDRLMLPNPVTIGA